MAEEQVCLESIYTYTYDQFTVFFYENHVFIGGKEYPVGQCCVDVVNLDETVLKKIDRRVWEYIPAAQALLTEKADSAAVLAQEKLNAVWDIVFSLPVYRDRMLAGLACFTDSLRRFRKQITGMAERYFEPLNRRNSAAYADAYSRFYADMLIVGMQQFHEDFDQSFPVEVNFVPMRERDDPDTMFIAEKATFNSLTDFLRTEFYRGLARGNAPRRCHNCEKYFLLMSGYNNCYCNNIAPGETSRTCRKVGAHRKEAQGKENRTPAQKEYEKTYNRLKVRKQRGKISKNEWNAAVAKAQGLVAQSERGELTDEELKKKLSML